LAVVHPDIKKSQAVNVKSSVLIRDYQRTDASAIASLFYETVHFVNLQDYSEQQVRAWAPAIPDPEVWHLRMSQRCTLVAEENGQIVAFAELEQDGLLDMFYCRRDAIGRGVGRALYKAVERKAVGLGLKHIFTEASITAVPFFIRCGFCSGQRQTIMRAGVELTNFRMEKRLPLRG
jgi:putative acetyltransferase